MIAPATQKPNPSTHQYQEYPSQRHHLIQKKKNTDSETLITQSHTFAAPRMIFAS